MFIDIFLLWFVNLFFPEKPRGRKRQSSHTYDTSSLLIADSLIRDKGSPKTFEDTDNSDPFLNEDYDDGPGW